MTPVATKIALGPMASAIATAVAKRFGPDRRSGWNLARLKAAITEGLRAALPPRT